MKNIIRTVVWVQAIVVLALFSQCTPSECEYKDLVCLECEVGLIENLKSGLCENISTEDAVLNGELFSISIGDNNIAYSEDGGNLYQIEDSLFPAYTVATGQLIYDVKNNVVPPIASKLPLFKGRLNSVSVWGPVPDNEWVGFATCIENEVKKKITIGLGADNMCRFKINGNLIVNLNTANIFNYRTWHMFEYELEAGINIVEIEALNTRGSAAFGAEIYDADISGVQSWRAISDLEQKLIFSTKDQLGRTFHTGTTSGYSCPDGYALDYCSGDTIPLCTLIERKAKVKCK